MASIRENISFYQDYDWSQSGEEWADAWGGSDMQWHGSILPRIHRFLPAKNVLELGAGYGRWAEYFLPHCERLVLVDLTQECVNFCRNKFSGNEKISCVQNDGASLDFVEDKSIDLIFSYHSLVHADDFTMNSYAKEISKKLATNGVAFVHHSNAGEYVNDVTIDFDLLSDYRDVSMTAQKMERFAQKAGLRCSSQELVNWETKELLDCFTVLARPNSLWGRSSRIIRNTDFMGEMGYFGRIAEIYGYGQTRACVPHLYSFPITVSDKGVNDHV